MATRTIPTTADIYLEADGKRVAVVQSYCVTTTRSSKTIEAFGQDEPVATIQGQNRYTIELSRLYATDAALSDGLDFHTMDNFSLVVCKPDRRIIYSGCQWDNLSERADVGGNILEQVRLISSHRVVTNA